jgi:hypothetical protein
MGVFFFQLTGSSILLLLLNGFLYSSVCLLALVHTGLQRSGGNLDKKEFNHSRKVLTQS